MIKYSMWLNNNPLSSFNLVEINPINRKAMPYNDLLSLPDTVRKHLPNHAQEIYLAAFNSAWEEYCAPENRQGKASREEVAHKVAWSAVKRKYEKKDGKWCLKN